MNIIGTRAVERVYLADPDEHPEAPSWEVRFGDADIERMKTVVGDAIERAQALTDERELRERLGDAEGARDIFSKYLTSGIPLHPTALAAHHARNGSNSASRRRSVSTLESATPAGTVSSGRSQASTAAAPTITGPASAPRPTSSNPTISS